MDLINEFVFILSKNIPDEFETILPNKSKVRQLYDLIVSGKVVNDKEASRIIYNSQIVNKKYLMLKRHLLQKLQRLVYLQDYEALDENNYIKLHFQLERELFIAEKMLLDNVYHNPIKIISRVEQMAEKYFFIDLQVSATKKIRTIYALKGFPKETEEYDKKIKELLKYQNYYNTSRGMWEKLYSKTKFTIAKLDYILIECEKSIKTIDSWLKLYNNPFIKLYFYYINTLLYYTDNKQNKVLEYIIMMQKLIYDYPFISNKLIQLDVYFYFARYYKDVMNLNKSLEYINKSFALCDYRAFNKFLIQSLYFDVLLKQRKYQEAGNVLIEVNSVIQYKFLNNYDKSAWIIREAYLYFIFKILNLNEQIYLLPIFSKPKSLILFLDETKKLVKNKYGYNISLLIIRAILYILNDYRDFDNEGNNMLVYYHRYLKNQKTSRTTIFFYQFAKSLSIGFLSDELIKRKHVFLSQISILDKVYDSVEIIPYELFWDYLIELSKNQASQKNYK